MPDDLTPPTAPESTDELQALRASVAKLEEKNRELKREKDAAKTAAAEAEELRQYKAKREQDELEARGKYNEARQALQEQYDKDTGDLKARIEELEAKIRDLELITPAASVLAQLVHDPDDVFKTGRLKPEQIEASADGPVVVDGFRRIPLADWARQSLPAYYLKAPPARGTGAPASRSSNASILASDPDLAAFVPVQRGGKYNLTRQQEIYQQDRGRYRQLLEAAGGAAT